MMETPPAIRRHRFGASKPGIDSFRKRLKSLMQERGIRDKPLAKAAGLGETAVRDLFAGKKGPRLDTVYAIAEQLDVPIADLLEGQEPTARRIPIIGCVSAGEGWTYFDGDGPIDELTMTFDIGEALALDVRGSSMEPVYRDGDMIIGTKRDGTDTRALIGQDCIVETKDGRRFIKFITKGSVRGRVSLRSYNPLHEDVRDVEIAWAAPIAVVIRGSRRLR